MTKQEIIHRIKLLGFNVDSNFIQILTYKNNNNICIQFKDTYLFMDNFDNTEEESTTIDFIDEDIMDKIITFIDTH